jgi:hypothetical protein
MRRAFLMALLRLETTGTVEEFKVYGMNSIWK